MANQEHKKRLEAGVESWNDWREANPGVTVDLKGIDLFNPIEEHICLAGINLAGADLRKARFTSCDFSNADFRGAELGGAYFGFSKLNGAQFEAATVLESEFSMSELIGADFRGLVSEPFPSRASFANSDLTDAHFDNGNFVNSDFHRTTLNRTRFTGGRFDGCEFIYAPEMVDADFSGTNLCESDFRFSKLAGANLDGADLSNIAVSAGTDLLLAKWDSILIDGETFERKRIQAGEQALPFGMGNPLRFVFRCTPQDAADLSTLQTIIEKINEDSDTMSVSFTVGPKHGPEFSVKSLGKTEETFLFGAVLSQFSDQLRQVSKQMDAHHEETTKQNDQLVELVYRFGRDQEQLLRLFRTFELVQIETQNLDDANRARDALEKKGFTSEQVTFKGRIIQIADAVRSSPVVAAAALGILGEVLMPGSFSLTAGGAAAMLDVSQRVRGR